MIPVVAIMPTANRRAFVPSAIACFLAQTYEDKRLLILDNGKDAVADLIPADSRIEYHRAIPGISSGTTGRLRNILCGQAGEENCLIAHWDDDDWSAPGRMAHQAARLQETGKKVTGFGKMFFWPGRYYRGISAPYVLGTSLCYYRSWWDANRFPDLRIGEDFQFARHAACLGVLDVAPECGLMVARIHSANTSHKRSFSGDDQWREAKREEFPAEFLKIGSRVG